MSVAHSAEFRACHERLAGSQRPVEELGPLPVGQPDLHVHGHEPAALETPDPRASAHAILERLGRVDVRRAILLAQRLEDVGGGANASAAFGMRTAFWRRPDVMCTIAVPPGISRPSSLFTSTMAR